MERSTVITLLVVVGLGGLVLWWYLRDGSSTLPAGQSVPDNCGSGVMGSIGNFIKGHVDRKNSIAPLVVSGYAKIPTAQASSIANIAGKLSPSNWVEGKLGNAIGNFFCNASLPSITGIKNAVENKVIKPGVAFGSTNLSAGTIGPVKSLYSAGDNLVHGNFGDAGKDIAKSVYEGPKAAVTSTVNLVKSLNPF